MPTSCGNSNVEALQSGLTRLLADATLSSLRSARLERECEGGGKTTSRVFVGPNEVFQRVLTQTSDFTKNFEEIASAKDWLLADERANAVDLFVVFHPGHRVVPSPMEYGGSFRLSSALEHDDRIWLIRPRSFFLQLLEDEYLLFPQTPEEHAIWPSAAEFWWNIRKAYQQAGIPLLRGSTASGWTELAFHLFESMFDLELFEPEAEKIQSQCSFSELIQNKSSCVLREMLEPFSLLTDVTRVIRSVQRNEELVRVVKFEIEALVTRFTFAQPSLLLSNLVEDLSEQRNLLSGALLQSISERTTDGSTPEPIRNALARLLTLLFPQHSELGLARSHSEWLKKHRPSYALVRWHPLGQSEAQPIAFFANGVNQTYSHEIQEARKNWYLESGGREGFTARFVSGNSSFPNVGTDYGPFPDDLAPQQERFLKPWVLTTDFAPFQDALELIRPLLHVTKDQSTDEDGLRRSIDEALATPRKKAGNILGIHFYLHYLLWYYEYFLGHNFYADCVNPLAHNLETGIERALTSVLPTLAYPESHFYAFTAPVTNELVEERRPPKMMTLSFGLAGSPLSTADVRMMNRIVDKLAELRTSDDAFFRERQLRRKINHIVGCTLFAGDASVETLRSDAEQLAVQRPSTVQLEKLIAATREGVPRRVTVLLGSEHLADRFRQTLESLLRAACNEGVEVSLTSGRTGRSEQEHGLEFALGSKIGFLDVISASLGRWSQIHRVLLRGNRGLTCCVYIPSIRGTNEGANQVLYLCENTCGAADDVNKGRDLLLRAFAAGCLVDQALVSGTGDIDDITRRWAGAEARKFDLRVESATLNGESVPLSSSQRRIAENASTDRVRDAAFFLANIAHNLDGCRLATLPDDDQRSSLRQAIRWATRLLDEDYSPEGSHDLYQVLDDAVDEAIVVVKKYRTFLVSGTDEWKSPDSVTFQYIRPPANKPRWSTIDCRADLLRSGLVQFLCNALRHAEAMPGGPDGFVRLECMTSDLSDSSIIQQHDIRIRNTASNGDEFLRFHSNASSSWKTSQGHLSGLLVAYWAFNECECTYSRRLRVDKPSVHTNEVEIGVHLSARVKR